mgnify:CR=1 FL=1
MIVRVTGGTKYQREVASIVIHLTAKQLGINRLRTLYIQTVLTKIKNADGYCSMEDDKKRTFTIEANKTLKLRQLIMTLIHEMVHVKQFARNEMNDYLVNGRYRWKSKTISQNTHNICVIAYCFFWNHDI